MRLALLGGTGRIGSHLLAGALESGHQVTALVRNPDALTPATGLTAVRGDAADAEVVAAALAGAQAVVSALGPRGAKTPGLLGTAGRNIVIAMNKTGVRGLICVSAAFAFIQDDPDMGALMKAILPRVLARQFTDTREMEAVA